MHLKIQLFTCFFPPTLCSSSDIYIYFSEEHLKIVHFLMHQPFFNLLSIYISRRIHCFHLFVCNGSSDVRMDVQKGISSINFETFTWKIENFSKQNIKSLRSKAFRIGGYKWYLPANEYELFKIFSFLLCTSCFHFI